MNIAKIKNYLKKTFKSSGESKSLSSVQSEVKAKAVSLSIERKKAMEAFGLNDYDTAKVHFEKMDKLDPEHPWANFYLRKCTGLSTTFYNSLLKSHPKVEQRAYLTGCGRSGTWLLTAILSSLETLRISDGECQLGEFAWMPNLPETQLVKRAHDAYLYFYSVPEDIKIIHVVRHPFDVLVSTHLAKKNLITLENLEAEHKAFFSKLQNRKNTLVVKYEDIVKNVEEVQTEIESFLNLKSQHPFKDFHMYAHTHLSDLVMKSMHGLRPLDPSRLSSWKNSESELEFLRNLIKDSDGTLAQFAEHFDYEIDI